MNGDNEKIWQDAEESTSEVLAASENLRTEAYASPLRSLRPCWKALLNILRGVHPRIQDQEAP